MGCVTTWSSIKSIIHHPLLEKNKSISLKLCMHFASRVAGPVGTLFRAENTTPLTQDMIFAVGINFNGFGSSEVMRFGLIMMTKRPNAKLLRFIQ
jgi:hypothetical protein